MVWKLASWKASLKGTKSILASTNQESTALLLDRHTRVIQLQSAAEAATSISNAFIAHSAKSVGQNQMFAYVGAYLHLRVTLHLHQHRKMRQQPFASPLQKIQDHS